MMGVTGGVTRRAPIAFVMLTNKVPKNSSQVVYTHRSVTGGSMRFRWPTSTHTDQSKTVVP